MPGIESPYLSCRELFATYPEAVRRVDSNGTVRSMVVMVHAGEHVGFCALVQDDNGDVPCYLLWPWPAGDIAEITEESGDAVPDLVMDVMRHGVPIPRDGSLFGWVLDGTVTALIAIYAESAPDLTEPSMAVMPLVGSPEAQWPPFAGERPFDHWSWEDFRAGRAISLDRTVAAHPATVWWVDAAEALGSNCCVVTRDVATSQGTVLGRGCYVYYRALEAGEPIPALEDLLGSPGKLDLAPRFQSESMANSRQ